MQIPSEAESGILRSSLDRDGKRTLSGMVRTGRQPPPDLHVHSSEVCFLSPTSSPTPAAEFKILATRRGFQGGHCRLTVWWSRPVGTQHIYQPNVLPQEAQVVLVKRHGV